MMEGKTTRLEVTAEGPAKSPIVNDELDVAWRIVRLAIEEAEGRYGMILHGRVQKVDGGFDIDLVWGKENLAFTQRVSSEFLATAVLDMDVFVEYGLMPSMRELVKKRDRR